ncbi:hypothetical protein [Methylobacterium sp. CM6257]|jgi:hypothetical protein
MGIRPGFGEHDHNVVALDLVPRTPIQTAARIESDGVAGCLASSDVILPG